MLRVTAQELRTLWSKIVHAVEEREAYLTDHPARPNEGPPASEWDLRRLEEHWGFPLPPSYRMFLGLYNGVERFAYGAPLLSTEAIKTADVRTWSVVDELDDELVRSVFAGSAYSNLFLCFDFRLQKPDGELDVVVFTVDGMVERHDGFVGFLEAYLSALYAGIDREKADREGLR